MYLVKKNLKTQCLLKTKYPKRRLVVYHNLILENFIEIHKTPSVLASSSNADEFIRLMSDYGAAMRLAYKNGTYIQVYTDIYIKETDTDIQISVSAPFYP